MPERCVQMRNNGVIVQCFIEIARHVASGYVPLVFISVLLCVSAVIKGEAATVHEFLFI